MTLIDTLEYFIDDQRGRLQDIEWEIREEGNYGHEEDHQSRLDYFCEEYDEAKARLDDLVQIKSIIEAQQ
jgi:hypothetical protein